MNSRNTRTCGALLAALLLTAGTAAAQTVPATGPAAARGGPALSAPANTAQPTPANQTPQATAPLPGQSALPQGLPPISGNGNGLGAANAARPGNATPTRTDSAQSAFTMLDSGNRGFVTRADMDRVSGFMGFDNADTNRDGQLSREEFANAWKFYSGQ